MKYLLFSRVQLPGLFYLVELSQITSMQNSRLQVSSPDSDLVWLNGMYVSKQMFIREGESALVSSMGNEIISLRLHIILLLLYWILRRIQVLLDWMGCMCVCANVKLLLCHPWENKQLECLITNNIVALLLYWITSHIKTLIYSLCINLHQYIFACWVLVLIRESVKIPEDHNYSLFVLDQTTKRRRCLQQSTQADKPQLILVASRCFFIKEL